MDFSEAFYFAKQGEKIARTGWNGKGLTVQVQYPDKHSKMSVPYMYISYPEDAKCNSGLNAPWVPSVSDLFAEDWTIV